VFWILYVSVICFFCYFLSLSFKGRIKNLIIFSSLVILLTPAQIEVDSNAYAPAIFTFIFNFLLEQNYSLRVLRPIFLSLPVSYLFLGLFVLAKKRF